MGLGVPADEVDRAIEREQERHAAAEQSDTIEVLEENVPAVMVFLRAVGEWVSAAMAAPTLIGVSAVARAAKYEFSLELIDRVQLLARLWADPDA